MVSAIAISKNGRWVASAGADNTIRVVDRERPEDARAWPARQSTTTSLAITSDGEWVAGGGDDGSVWVWNRERPSVPPKMWTGNQTPVNSVAVSDDGRWLLFGQADGMLWLGAVNEQDLKSRACHAAARNLSLTEWRSYFGAEPYRESCPGFPVPSNINVPDDLAIKIQ
jgi:WD40 repeat protein